jgi:alpha-tubulin suppressor-like RCC1 family protein
LTTASARRSRLWLSLAIVITMVSGIGSPLQASSSAQAESLQEFLSSPTPTIAGDLSVGSTVNVETEMWNPVANFAYQWVRDGVPIKNATSSSYTILPADYAKSISVRVEATKQGFRTLLRLSLASLSVRSGNFVPPEVPSFAGQIAAGGTNTCGVQPSGLVQCVGGNYNGQLGDGSTINSSTPLTVPSVTSATSVDIGSSFMCSVLADGSIKCWGYNGYGQLGDGTTVQSSTPVAVTGITSAVSVSAGGSHACAVLTDGSIKCWGSNVLGQLGDGSQLGASIPVSVTGITSAVSVSAGIAHTCAVLEDGSVECWGWNSLGQANGGSLVETVAPVAVPGITSAVTVSAGAWHTCTLLADGSVKCWGNNGRGQFGDGGDQLGTTPTLVAGITSAVSVSADANGHYTCATLENRTVSCWGTVFGNIRTVMSYFPEPVVEIASAVSLAVGGGHVCALLADGAVVCWGNNLEGALGNGSMTSTSVPVDASGFGGHFAIEPPIPSVTGSRVVGQILTADPGSWSPAADSFAYVWKRAGVPISGATARTYELQAVDGGAVISVTVTGIKSGYTSVSQTSVESAVVTPLSFETTSLPTLSGDTTVGQTLTVDPGSWSPAVDSFAYVWKRGSAVIEGASRSTYVLQPADAGHVITAAVTGVKVGYSSDVKVSAPTGLVDLASFISATSPTISGSVVVGQTLTAVPGTWSPAATFGYVWKRNGFVISGETSESYVVQSSDAGQTLTVTMTASKPGFASLKLASVPTDVVDLASFVAAPTPILSGLGVVGQTLTAVTGMWNPVPEGFTYVWKRNALIITGATSATYILQEIDLGQTLTVTVRGSKADYASVRLTSVPTVAIVAAFDSSPVPTISGSVVVGQTLTAVQGTWSPAATFGYAWKRDGVVIDGVSASTYRLAPKDVGSKISVVVTGVKDGYASTSQTSVESAVVTPLSFETTSLPTLSGDTTVGQTLTANPGSWSPAADSFAYVWKRGSTVIGGASRSTYVLQPADAGHVITAAVTGVKVGYSSDAKVSAPTIVISVAPFDSSPVPTISGSAVVGQTLTAVPGTWSPAATFGYVWKRDGVVIDGVSASTYRLAPTDVGSKITVEVTAVAVGYGSTMRVSAQSVSVAPTVFTVSPLPIISGVTTVGQTLMAATGSWSPAADSFAFVWKRAGVPISGATARTYELQAVDGGAVVSVTVTGIKSGYTSVSQTSAETAAIVRTFTSMPTPVLSGVTTVGQRLTALPGTWSPSPTLTYVWKRDGVVISGQASSGYRLVAADAGKQITVEVTGTRAGYVSETKTSAPTDAVTGLPFVTTPAPTIMGEATVGQTVSAVAGTWSPLAESYTYVWKRGGVPISGATGQSYELQLADAGTVISVSVTAVKQGYMPAPQTSANTAAVLRAFASPPTPTIAGVATVGQRLQSTTGTWSPSPTFTYVWKRDGVVISGQASSGYRLVPADAGKRISVEVYGSRAGYATTGRTSLTTDFVAALPFLTTPVPTISGTATVGLSLTAVPGVWSPVVESYTYVWKRSGTIISGASASAYKLVSADLGNTITVEVTGVKLGYVASTQTSVATAVVSAPAFTLAPIPTILGTAIVGQRLTASVGIWSPAPTFTYVWKRDGVVIVGANSSGYRPGSGDLGKRITVEVTGTRTGYLTAMRASLATAAVTR